MTRNEINTANLAGKVKSRSRKYEIVFLGRLSKNRGVEILLKAILSLQNSSNYKLTIVGDGEEREMLEEMSRSFGLSDIHFIGWKTQEEIKKVLINAHIICQPTLYTESWGKTLQEGMSYGLVPIASNLGGLRKQLSQKPSLLFKPGDPDALSKAIQSVTKSDEVYRTYSEWSMKESSRHSLDNLKDDMKRILSERSIIK